MISEHVVYRPTSTLDKLIIFDAPIYTGTTWTQLGAVFLDDYPNFIVRCHALPALQSPFLPGAASAYPSPQPPTPSSPFSDATYYPPTPTPPPTHPNSFNKVLTSFPPYVFEAVSDEETEKELNFVYNGSIPYWKKSNKKAANEIRVSLSIYTDSISNMISDYYYYVMPYYRRTACVMRKIISINTILLLLISRICYYIVCY